MTFASDARGNVLQKAGGGPTWDYAWNHENLLTTATKDGVRQEAYRYDALGRRVKVEGTSASMWTVSLFSGMDVAYEVDQAGAKTKYARANGMLTWAPPGRCEMRTGTSSSPPSTSPSGGRTT